MKHEPEFDDYTPENVEGVDASGIGYLIAVIIAFAAVMTCFVLIAKKDDDIYIDRKNHIVIDTVTHSPAYRAPLRIYVRTELRYFYPGDTVTSKANGAMILWDSLRHPKSWIVGIISDSGTIERIKPK